MGLNQMMHVISLDYFKCSMNIFYNISIIQLVFSVIFVYLLLIAVSEKSML